MWLGSCISPPGQECRGQGDAGARATPTRAPPQSLDSRDEAPHLSSVTGANSALRRAGRPGMGGIRDVSLSSMVDPGGRQQRRHQARGSLCRLQRQPPPPAHSSSRVAPSAELVPRDLRADASAGGCNLCPAGDSCWLALLSPPFSLGYRLSQGRGPELCDSGDERGGSNATPSCNGAGDAPRPKSHRAARSEDSLNTRTDTEVC